MSTLRTIELSPATRADHLAPLRAADADHPLDVLVVGGGSAGVGAAFDAGLAAGFWASTAELAAHWSEDRRWEPAMDPERAARLLRLWARAVERSRGWIDDDVEALAAETRTAPDATPAGRTP